MHFRNKVRVGTREALPISHAADILEHLLVGIFFPAEKGKVRTPPVDCSLQRNVLRRLRRIASAVLVGRCEGGFSLAPAKPVGLKG